MDWFSEPRYLYDDNPLGVRCDEDGSDIDRLYGSVVRITQIDPTSVLVEYDPVDNTFIMIRDQGWNTRTRTK